LAVHAGRKYRQRVRAGRPASPGDVPGAVAPVAGEQAEAGHNLSLGLSALAYHLKVLSFAEECVLGRENSVHTRDSLWLQGP